MQWASYYSLYKTTIRNNNAERLVRESIHSHEIRFIDNRLILLLHYYYYYYILLHINNIMGYP